MYTMPTPPVLQGLYDAEQPRGLTLGQRRRGLIHDEHTQVGEEAFGDFDHLLLTYGKHADLGIQRYMHAKLFEGVLGFGFHFPGVEQTARIGDFLPRNRFSSTVISGQQFIS
jgi:hypothetical protein